MPTYDYECEKEGTLTERMVPIATRDEQVCDFCKSPLKRIVSFNGLTWAPTAGGMR